MPLFLKLLRLVFIGIFGISVAAGIIAVGAFLYFAPGLPSVSTLKDVELQVPLKVFSRDSKLIAVYGEKRRQPLQIKQYPQPVIQAFLAAEDDRFYQHPGVDYQGLIRAAIEVLRTGEKRQGGSTITMQLARNFFLGNERTYVRKLREILLALQIEHELSKDEILELYLNKIYLGNRAYGVGAAADVYYGLNVDELSISQIAMIAGLPKAPSRFNPIINPDRALVRRNYVLGRMLHLRFIDKDTYRNSIEAEVTASRHYPRVEVDAPYIGEMARAFIVDIFGTADAYNKGYRVYTTVDTRLQQAARQALVKGLRDYDKRHGYRGVESKVEGITNEMGEIDTEKLDETLRVLTEIGSLVPGVVTAVSKDDLQVYIGADRAIAIPLKSAEWARPYLNENAMGEAPSDLTKMFAVGDVIRVTTEDSKQWSLEQVPEVSGALVSVDPQNGGILALVGGFDYYYSKFNRAVQARRQPGSSFKPFIYSAALDSGYTPASIINDAPVVFEDVALEDTWRPQNYSGKFFGPTRLRVALFKSRNMVSIRLLNDMGRRHAMQHIAKFGFDRERLPYDLTLALGSGAVTPLELAKGYAVFANGGYLIEPYLIERIENDKGEVLFSAEALAVCESDCLQLQQQISEEEAITNKTTVIETSEVSKQPELSSDLPSKLRIASRVLENENAYQMVSMMQDVIKRGTGTKAKVLGRDDLAGKTGTTNEQHDAWFSGFNGDVVATTWVGFDQDRPLGKREVGGTAALPIWIDYMRTALDGKAENTLQTPQGIVTMRIDPKTGLLVDQDSNQGIQETFREQYIPTTSVEVGNQITFQQQGGEPGEVIEIPEQLF
ncbi:MAG: PBP1A family penicillin-binding protein [Gammaproteobacteria bacterium]|nr:MAG: PBP1A family penicillin-binding protein [Gammaproteobacteria bacterium]